MEDSGKGLKHNYRHEYKHEINLGDQLILKSRLTPLMKQDPNARADGTYFVRSLYFDTHDDKALQEKLHGIEVREKFRIRTYNHNPNFIRLEKKSKHGGYATKTSTPLSREECEAILANRIEWMKGSPHELLREFYEKLLNQHLQPKTIVDYTREAFIYKAGNVRVTIDSNLRSGVYSTDFFNPQIPTLHGTMPGIGILEVKYDAFLPDFIRDIIQLGHRGRQANSKYALCRVYG